jgi:UDP-glucose 4-epimerase
MTTSGVRLHGDGAMLGWTPQYDDLATIIAHALAWEQRLRRREFAE